MIDELLENEHLYNAEGVDDWVGSVMRLQDGDGWDQNLGDLVILAAANVYGVVIAVHSNGQVYIMEPREATAEKQQVLGGGTTVAPGHPHRGQFFCTQCRSALYMGCVQGQAGILQARGMFTGRAGGGWQCVSFATTSRLHPTLTQGSVGNWCHYEIGAGERVGPASRVLLHRCKRKLGTRTGRSKPCPTSGLER